MSKRILAFLCAVLLLFGSTVPVCALIAVEDENGVVHYSTDEEDDTKAPSAVKQWAQRSLQRLKDFWLRRGVLTIAILLVVCILGAVVVLTIEDEKKKKAAVEKQPNKSHKER